MLFLKKKKVIDIFFLLDCILAFAQIKLFPHMLWMQVGQNTRVCPREGGGGGEHSLKRIFRVICF